MKIAKKTCRFIVNKYKLILFVCISQFLYIPHALAVPITWPLDGNQKTTPIANVYGQYNDFGGQQYTHPGVDFHAKSGTKVVSGTTGKVSLVQAAPPESQGVLVKEAPTNDWAWAYYHLNIKPGTSVGDAVVPATELGAVYNFSPNWDHLHLGYVDASNPVDTGKQNPLRHVPYSDTKAPTIQEKDGFKMYPNQTENVYFEATIPNTDLGVAGKNQTLVGIRAPLVGAAKNPKKSEIDVAVSAYDEINDSPYHLGLYRMGYWIDGFNYLPDSADVKPHTTFRFWDAAPNQTDGAKNLIYKDDTKAGSSGNWTAAAGNSESTNGGGTFWHIVTNTTDTSFEGNSNSSGLSRDAAWKTVGGAAKNAQARSPDGEYNIVSYAHDLKLNSDADFTRVRVDNFEQLAGVRSDKTPEFIASPKYKLPAESAAVDPYVIELGEDIFTKSIEMLADDIIDAYLFEHRDWWTEGDLLTDYIASTTLTSDSSGNTDWGYIWTATEYGFYDIIFDYDHDGVFSYTLDPLIAFRVPEPATILLFAFGLFIIRSSLQNNRGENTKQWVTQSIL